MGEGEGKSFLKSTFGTFSSREKSHKVTIQGELWSKILSLLSFLPSSSDQTKEKTFFPAPFQDGRVLNVRVRFNCELENSLQAFVLKHSFSSVNAS